MNYEQFKTIVEQANIGSLGVSFRRFAKVDSVSIVPGLDKITSYEAIFENEFVKLRFSFLATAEKMDFWITKSEYEYFTISEYLQFKNKHNQLPRLEQQSQETTQEYAQRFLKFIVTLLKTDLKPIIEAKIWEEVPRDWMGYK